MADLATLKRAMAELQRTHGARHFLFIAPIDRTTAWDELDVWESVCAGHQLPEALLERRADLELYILSFEDQKRMARLEPFTIHRWSQGVPLADQRP